MGLRTGYSPKISTPTAWADIPDKPATFPPSSHTHQIADVSNLQATLDAKATPATVTAAINALVNGAPAALDTLNEIATQLASDESAVAALTSTVSGKASQASVTALAATIPSVATATPLVENGTGAVGTATKYAREDHVHPALPIAVTPSTPARTIGGATFQPHATKPVLCIYSIKTQVTNPLLVGTSTATVQLLSDSASTPTTERGRVEASSGVGLTVTVALTTANTSLLVYLCPPAHYVKLVQTIAGTGQTSIVSQVEIALG